MDWIQDPCPLVMMKGRAGAGTWRTEEVTGRGISPCSSFFSPVPVVLTIISTIVPDTFFLYFPISSH
jgi:hypothetical protein